jgi:excisionase family DNA binding protein
MNRYIYEAIFTPNELSGYDVSLPDFDVMTQGDSLEDAAYMAQDLLSTLISAELSAGAEVNRTGSFGHTVPEDGLAMGILVIAEATTNIDKYMTTQEAADILDVTRPRIYAMIKDGTLRTQKVGNKRLVMVDDVMERFNNPKRPGRPSSQPAWEA